MEGRKLVSLKRLTALIMAIVMVILVSVPAVAGSTDTYTITINSEKSGHTYQAYQIFAGEVSEDETTLSDITWGSGIDDSKYDTIYSELAAITVTDGTDTYYPFTSTPTVSGGTALTTAAAVADALATYPDAAEAFADVINKYLSTTYVESSEDPTYTYKITVTGSGYYLIKDKDDSVTTAGDAYTDLMLKVVADVTATAKTVYPTVTKTLSDDDYEAASIGDTVSYIITGTIPDTSAYTSYTYIFNDTLSKGLTYVTDSLEVYVTTDFATGVYELNDGEFEVTTDTEASAGKTYYKKLTEDTDYTLEVGTYDSTNGTTITVTMSDAKSLSESSVVIVYSATLNANAVIGGDGNTNTVNLTYSNNPNDSSGEGSTPSSGSNTFTFELDVTKVDGQDATKKLEDAEFVLYKDVEGTLYYATATESSGVYTITGWTDDDADATTFVSGSDGTFNIKGLDTGTYYLKETKAPDGYNTIADAIEVEIAATYEDTDDDGIYDGVKTLTIAVNDGTPENGNTSTGVVTMDVQNNAGSVMPTTGGIGVTVYIVGGLVLIVAALGALTVLKVRGKKTEG